MNQEDCYNYLHTVTAIKQLIISEACVKLASERISAIRGSRPQPTLALLNGFLEFVELQGELSALESLDKSIMRGNYE